MSSSFLKVSRIWRLAAGCALVVAMGAIPASAELLSLDSKYGTNTATFDSQTGLYWLDVTLSTPYSYDGVLQELQAGGLFQGFRLATTAEIFALWGHAGIPDVESGFVAANYDPVVSLMNLVGVTGPGMGNLGGGRWFDYTAGHIESGPGGGGWVMMAVLGAEPATLTAEAVFAGVPSDNQNSSHGAWLVTESPLAPVPDPGSSLLLLGMGLVGLRAWRKRLQ